MIKLALPRGSIQKDVSQIFDQLSIQIPEYNPSNRVYRYQFNNIDSAIARSFAEKDIPIQVALGNYDLGIVTSWWVDELLIKYPYLDIENLIHLSDASSILYSVTAKHDFALNDSLNEHIVVTEFPNITADYLYANRSSNYRVFEVWGNPETWLYGDASVAILPEEKINNNINIVDAIYKGSLVLIGNKKNMKQTKESELFSLLNQFKEIDQGKAVNKNNNKINQHINNKTKNIQSRDKIRLAVPDGHAFRHTAKVLNSAGIEITGYTDSETIQPDLSNNIDMLVNVMRPQDMPQAIALGLYDIAITGRDWLKNFVYNFPTAPVFEMHDLKESKYRIGAVIDKNLNAKNIDEAINIWAKHGINKIRIASEYYGIADYFARNTIKSEYQIIPISGASEGFVPEDAEILVEGTETGTTLEANNLEMKDLILESTNCIIGHTNLINNENPLIVDFINRFK